MGLFDINDVRIPALNTKSEKTTHDRAVRLEKRSSTSCKLSRHVQAERLAELVPTIEHGSTWHIVGAGSWSNFDLVTHLARLATPVELWFSTWGISDPGVRAINHMITNGWVTGVHAVLDGHTAVQHSGATAFLRDISVRLGILPCHAKAYVLLGKKLNISIITSSNLTNNPWLEVGVITESKMIADFHRDWIDKAIRRAKPFEDNNDTKKRQQGTR